MRKNTEVVNKNSKVKKIFKIMGASLLAIVLTGIIGISGFTGMSIADGMTYLNKDKDTNYCSIKQLESWNYDTEKFEKSYRGEEVSFKAEDENIVPGVFYRSSEESNNTVILIHGLGGDYVSVYPQAEIYLNNGWNVLAIDQRASGRSEAEEVSFGYYEALDVKAAVDYIKSENKEGKLVVHGVSMGAATTGIYSGTEHAKDRVDSFILDSAYDSMENMFLLQWERMETGMPNDYAIFCGNIGLKLKFGYDFNDVNVVESVKSCEVPTLVIQGEKDTVSTVEMGEEIFKSIKTDEKEFWLMDSKHIEVVIDYPVQYKEKVLNFIN